MAEDDRIGVLHLISGLGLGGAERMILWSAQAHDRSRFRLGVVSLLSGGELAAPLRDTGVPLFELGWGRIPSPAALLRLRRTVRRFSPAVIQGHMFHGNLLARLLGVSLPAAVLSTRHNQPEARWRRLLNRATLPLTAGTVVFAPGVGEAERRDRGERRPVWTLPYGIPAPEPAPSREEARGRLSLPPAAGVLVAAGRLVPQKGFDILLDAFASLGSSLAPGPFLLLAGEGREEEALKGQARRLGVEGRVRFLGSSLPLPWAFAAADAFVLPSRWEGGPLVLLEAMDAGLPAAATRVGAVEEMVEEGSTGLIVPANDPTALAQACRRLLELGDARRGWGQRGRERVRARFSFTTTQRRQEELWARAAGERRARWGGR